MGILWVNQLSFPELYNSYHLCEITKMDEKHCARKGKKIKKLMEEEAEGENGRKREKNKKIKMLVEEEVKKLKGKRKKVKKIK